MKLPPALLLDVSASTAPSIALRRTLEGHFAIIGPAKFESVKDSDPAPLESELDGMIRQFDPSLIFLVSICADLKGSRPLLTAIRRIAPAIPVIVVLED